MRNYLDIVSSCASKLSEAFTERGNYSMIASLLSEGREDGIMNRFVPEILKKPELLQMSNHVQQMVGQFVPPVPEAEQTQEKINEAWAKGVVLFVIDRDPDPKKTFSTWIMIRFMKGELNLEDMPRLVDCLKLYTECKRNNLIPRSHDLGTVKDLHEFYALIAQFRTINGKVHDLPYETKMLAQTDVILDDAEYRILNLKTEAAAQWFGRDSEWCTAYGFKRGRHPTKTCMFDTYNDGPLYFIEFKPTGEIWQFSFKHSQLMDSDDRYIRVRDWVHKHMRAARALGTHNFFGNLKELGLSFFSDADLAKVTDNARLASAILTAEDFKRIPQSKLAETSFLKNILLSFEVEREGRDPSLLQRVILPAILRAMKPSDVIQGISGSNRHFKYFAMLPPTFHTEEMKLDFIHQAGMTAESIKIYIPQPWTTRIKEVYYETGIRLGSMKPSEVPAEFLSDSLLMTGLATFHGEIAQFARRLTPEKIATLITRVYSKVPEFVQSAPTNLRNTPEVAKAVHEMGKLHGTKTGNNDIWTAYAYLDHNLWPWGTKSSVKRIVEEWPHDFTKLPRQAQTDENAAFYAASQPWNVGTVPGQFVTDEMLMKAILVKKRNGYDLREEDKGDIKLLLTRLDPANVAPDRLTNILRTVGKDIDITRYYNFLPQAYRTTPLVQEMISRGKLDPKAPEFKREFLTPEAIKKFTHEARDSVRSQFSKLHQSYQYYRDDDRNGKRKTEADQQYLGMIKAQVWEAFPEDVRSPELAAAMVRECKEIVAVIPKEMRTAVLLNAFSQGDRYDNYHSSYSVGGRANYAPVFGSDDIFKLFPKSAYTKENAAQAVKHGWLKSIPDELKSNDAIVHALRNSEHAKKIDWSDVTPEILARAVLGDNGDNSVTGGAIGLIYNADKMPKALLTNNEVSQAFIKKAGIYYNDRVREVYVKPANRVGWTKETYDMAVKSGILLPSEVPGDMRDEGAIAAGLERNPHAIADIPDKVEFLNRHGVKAMDALLDYGLVKTASGWIEPKPDQKTVDGGFKILTGKTKKYGFLFDNKGEFVDVLLDQDWSGHGHGKVRGLFRRRREGGGMGSGPKKREEGISPQTIRHTIAAAANAMAAQGEHWGSDLEASLYELRIYKLNDEFQLVEELKDRTRVGSIDYFVPPNRWGDKEVLFFVAREPKFIARAVFKDNRNYPAFEAGEVASPPGGIFEHAKSIAAAFEKLGFQSANNPKFKESPFYMKLGLRCPGAGDWSSLLDEKILEGQKLSVWRSGTKITVAHADSGILAVGKKTKDGSFTSTESVVVPKELSSSLLAFLDNIQGKL